MQVCEENLFFADHLIMNCKLKQPHDSTLDCDIYTFLQVVTDELKCKSSTPILFSEKCSSRKSVVLKLDNGHICLYILEQTLYFDLLYRKHFNQLNIRKLVCQYFPLSSNEEILLQRGI